MTKTVFVLAALAAIGFSGAAFAEEASTGSRTITTGPAAMTDSEMDKVTAGTSLDVTPPCGGRCLRKSREIHDAADQATTLTEPPTGVVELRGPSY